jgi:hypothetical protein
MPQLLMRRDARQGRDRRYPNRKRLYCVTAPGIAPSSVSAAVSLEYINTASMTDSSPYVTAFPTGSDCPGSSDFEVVTSRQTGGASPATADDIGFTIVIP